MKKKNSINLKKTVAEFIFVMRPNDKPPKRNAEISVLGGVHIRLIGSSAKTYPHSFFL